MGRSFYPNAYVFPPPAGIDEYLAIVQGPRRVVYARVVWLEQIPEYSVEFLLKPAGSSGSFMTNQELEKIEVGNNEILNFRMSMAGPGKIIVKIPRTVTRFSLRRDSSYITENIARYPKFPPQTELNILEDTHLFVDVYNLNPNHSELVKLFITGWRMVVEPATETPRSYAAVITQGFAPRV